MARPRYHEPYVRQPDVRDDVVRRDDRFVAEDRSLTAFNFGPGQLVSFGVGVVVTVFGAIALVRTGLKFSNISATHTTVGGFHHTSLSAVIEIAFGLFVIVGALVNPRSAFVAFCGVIAVAAGIVVLADSTRLHASLGVHDRNGWAAIVLGGALLLATLLPVWSYGRHTTYGRRRTTV